MSPTTNLLKFADFDITGTGKRLHFKQEGSDRLKSLGVIQNINSLMVSMWQAFQLYKPGLVFEPAYPPYVLDRSEQEVWQTISNTSVKDIPDEIITWNVIRRTPGTLSGSALRGGVNSPGVKEIRPSVREELVYDPKLSLDPIDEDVYNGPGSHSPRPETARVLGVQIEGQYFDNLIQFDVWSRNNKTAEELADMLEDFMTDFRGMFIELGVIKMHFHSRIRDEMILNWKNGLANRSLLYYVRTEKVKATPVREIKTIHVDASIKKLIEVVDDQGIDNFLYAYHEKIIQRWVERNKTIQSIGG